MRFFSIFFFQINILELCVPVFRSRDKLIDSKCDNNLDIGNLPKRDKFKESKTNFQALH